MADRRTVGDMLADTLITAMKEKEEQLDKEIEKLDNMKEDDIEEIRRKRLEEMKEDYKASLELRSKGHGEYKELHSEREFFEAAKVSKLMVCHFYRPTTWRCQIVDKHLSVLAEKYIGTRFVKINAEKSPFLCDRFRIMMLPTIMLVKDGKTEHSVIGFDEFGGRDDFDTDAIEESIYNNLIVVYIEVIITVVVKAVCRNASKQLSGSVRRMSIKPEAQRKEVEWSRRVTLPLADVVHKDAVAVTGSLDLFDERVASKQHDGKQQKRAREQRRKAWMGKEVTPWMENGWDYEGKWRGEHLPEDPTVPYGVLPNAHLRKAVLIKKDSGLKRWIPIVNLPPGDLIEVACSTPGKYHLDPAFWDALCRRAEYISHCFSVKQIRRLLGEAAAANTYGSPLNMPCLGALASAECKAHPGLLRKMSSELLERFPQLTLLTCSECAEAYQKLEYDHTGTYNMLALAFVQEMEDIRYPLVGSEKSRQSTSPERALQMAAKILTAFSKAKLNGATPNDLLDCCAHTLYSHREVLKDCVDDYIAAVDAYRRFSRAVTAIELARIILASDIALEVHRIGRLARAVHGLEGNVMIATELADCVRASVKDATALRGGDTVELTVQREDHGNELDEFGMPTRRISSRKITIEIDRLIDLIECLMAVGQEGVLIPIVGH
ncbi:hypothetical protein Pmar_PMAR029307 [Perkinsus marinus ATCC 50983]|uniref:Thioredoxin domain-containing protein n=1 Tax=Perkinsus marinus (strain ATCC 50983 / TXsc) TaxID=423536 RepID=C5KMT3_PERM5|nr:hypothetical protein Pmar_PMAR029307 [Perkinsus marinus ATCC 50983]EER14241.1 hypothetical protein Pmar_PMAR029307 [Perkinsus marinus ATCC 50983]|eukprot:XP_002782446.1 hypothetical protein Pmar_PMAR029307 [Perkinsus marinus ATCC 50983]